MIALTKLGSKTINLFINIILESEWASSSFTRPILSISWYNTARLSSICPCSICSIANLLIEAWYFSYISWFEAFPAIILLYNTARLRYDNVLSYWKYIWIILGIELTSLSSIEIKYASYKPVIRSSSSIPFSNQSWYFEWYCCPLIR